MDFLSRPTDIDKGTHDNEAVIGIPNNIIMNTSVMKSPSFVTASPDFLPVKLLLTDAQLPTCGSDNAARHDLYSAVELQVPLHRKALIDTQIAIDIPTDAYGRIAP